MELSFQQLSISVCSVCGSNGSPLDCVDKIVSYVLDPMSPFMRQLSYERFRSLQVHLSTAASHCGLSIQLHDALYEVFEHYYGLVCWYCCTVPYDLDPSHDRHIWQYAALRSTFPCDVYGRALMEEFICVLLLCLVTERKSLIGPEFQWILDICAEYSTARVADI